MMEHENGSFYVCGSSRNVPEDIYNAMKEVRKPLVARVVGFGGLGVLRLRTGRCWWRWRIIRNAADRGIRGGVGHYE